MVIGAGVWELDDVNIITFVLVDAANAEVTGLGGTFTLEVSKNGGAFVGSAGAKSEISDGWYMYVATAGEADTVGSVSIFVTGVGAVQQNLEYVVEYRNIEAIEFQYTVTNAISGDPLSGVRVWFTTDISGSNVVWQGLTDAFGVARNEFGVLPRLDPGTWYVWRNKIGFDFADPDTEVITP